jgi:hypothetical protein
MVVDRYNLATREVFRAAGEAFAYRHMGGPHPPALARKLQEARDAYVIAKRDYEFAKTHAIKMFARFGVDAIAVRLFRPEDQNENSFKRCLATIAELKDRIPLRALAGIAKRAAELITKTPGMLGKDIALELRCNEEHFRRVFSRELSPRGFFNRDGYQPPSSA